MRTRVMLGDFPQLLQRGGGAIPARKGWGGVSRREKGIGRTLEYTAVHRGRRDLMT